MLEGRSNSIKFNFVYEASVTSTPPVIILNLKHGDNISSPLVKCVILVFPVSMEMYSPDAPGCQMRLWTVNMNSLISMNALTRLWVWLDGWMDGWLDAWVDKRAFSLCILCVFKHSKGFTSLLLNLRTHLQHRKCVERESGARQQ